MEHKYILITVIDREITVQKCIDLKEAQDKMCEEFNKYTSTGHSYEGELLEMEAWVNVGDNDDTECDWKIVEI